MPAIVIHPRLNERIEKWRELDRANSSHTSRARALAEIVDYTDSSDQPVESLIGAVASRLLFDSASIPNDCAKASKRWQSFTVESTGSLPPTPSLLLTAASLLYDQGDYKCARDLFERYLSSGTQDPKPLFLWAYCCEALGRNNRDVKVIQDALARLEEIRVAPLKDDYSAEAWHVSGHLWIAHQFAANSPTSAAHLSAIQAMERAVDQNRAYTSCLTSAHAELGDYVGSINASLDALHDQPYSQLRQATIVEMEVLFYLAYAFSCMGEYERALRSFDHFANRMQDAEFGKARQEARNHAMLFRIKTNLKRLMLADLDLDTVRDMTADLNALSFQSQFSAKVSEEASRYEVILKFISSLVGFRSENQASNWNTVVREAGVVIKELSVVDAPSAGPIVTVINEADDKTSKEALIASCGKPQVVLEDWFGRAERQLLGDIIVTIHPGMDTLKKLVTDYAPNRYVIALSPNPNDLICKELSMDSVVDEALLSQYVTVASALVMSKRYLIQDRYVFGLAPCIDSPALRFQKPDYNDLISALLG